MASLTKISSETSLLLRSQLRNIAFASADLSVEKTSRQSELKLWHIALIFGVPSAAFIAYYIYYKRNKAKKTNSAEGKKAEVESKNLDETKQPQQQQQQQAKLKEKTPLEKAVEIKNVGNEYFQSGKFEEALKCYAEAISLCPSNDKEERPKFYQNRAAAYENLKNFEKVIEDCNEALKIDANYTKALTRRAKAYENLDKLQEAFEDYTALCILQKFSSTSMAAADRLVKKIGVKMGKEIFKNRSSIPISQHFVNNFFIGLNNDVVFKNKKFYEKVKEYPDSYMSEAIDSFNTGDYTKCIELCCKEISESKRFHLEARNLRGSLYMLKCQYKEAQEDFDAILNSNDETASDRLKSNTYIKLTALNLQNSDDDKAFENYENAIGIDPSNEDVYCNRAQVNAMKGKFDECFKDFQKCIDLNSEHKIAKLQKAFFEFRSFYAQLSMYMQASGAPPAEMLESRALKEETDKLEKMIEQYSDVPEAYNLYAQILSEQEKYEKAEHYYMTALQRDTKNAALLVQRALNIMQWKNDFEESIKMLNDAIKVDETCEFAYETLATIEIQRGNLPRAVELFEKAIQLTRSEDSMTNLCCMLVGAKTQFKILQQYAGANNSFNL